MPHHAVHTDNMPTKRQPAVFLAQQPDKICGVKTAPIVNGGGDSFWKWKDFQLSKARDLDLGSGHNAYRRASLIDLYLHYKFHWNWRNFLWMEGRTYVRTNRPTLLCRLRRVNLKNYSSLLHCYNNTTWRIFLFIRQPMWHKIKLEQRVGCYIMCTEAIRKQLY